MSKKIAKWDKKVKSWCKKIDIIIQGVDHTRKALYFQGYMMWGDQSFSDIGIEAKLNKRGDITNFSYVNMGARDLNDDNLYVNVAVSDANKFLKRSRGVFNGYIVNDYNISNFARAIDSVPGVEKGPESTYVGFIGTDISALA